jgi:hypothetical protein
MAPTNPIIDDDAGFTWPERAAIDLHLWPKVVRRRVVAAV